MDISSIIGLVLGLGVVLAASLMGGVDLKMLFDVQALMLIFGGTTAATMISFPLGTLMAGLVGGIKTVFFAKKSEEAEMIVTLVSFAEKARREGLLALEAAANEMPDEFMRKGMQLVIDGRDTEVIRKILETEVSFVAERLAKNEAVYSTMGGYSPTMGIIGTVLGLISMLKGLANMGAGGNITGSIGAATAVAFIATFYGILTANILWLPFAGKIKERNTAMMLLREIQIEGILSVQAGDNPRLLEEKLQAYLDPAKRKTEDATAAASGAKLQEA